MFKINIGLIIIPLFFVLAGLFLSRFQPKTINWVYGYRTFRAMKSEEAWNFANQYSAKLLVNTGLIAVIISAIILGVYRGDVEAIEDLHNVIIPIQLVWITGFTLFSTEIQLRKRFDKDGKPK